MNNSLFCFAYGGFGTCDCVNLRVSHCFSGSWFSLVGDMTDESLIRCGWTRFRHTDKYLQSPAHAFIALMYLMNLFCTIYGPHVITYIPHAWKTHSDLNIATSSTEAVTRPGIIPQESLVDCSRPQLSWRNIQQHDTCDSTLNYSVSPLTGCVEPGHSHPFRNKHPPMWEG